MSGDPAAPGLVAPHGGRLVHRVLAGEALAEARARAAGLPAVPLDARAASDLELLAVGAFSPLEGFMGRADYRAVMEDMRLAGGLLWPLPVTLAVRAEDARGLKEGGDVALRGPRGALLGILHLEEKHANDPRREARLVYGTEDSRHPGVAALAARGEVLLGGPVDLLARPPLPGPAAWRLDPAATRAAFQARGWRRVTAFQTRNPIHRSHEYIQKCALEFTDGLLIHPLVGATKGDDLPADVRLRACAALVRHYFPRDRVLLAVFPGAMRYAGPREALFHALVRKNYGCTHFIVGRDAAGVGSYYAPYAAHDLFRSLPPEELGIEPLLFVETFFCRRCGAVASLRTCPHPEADRVALSGSRVRELLMDGEALPAEFTRPEVAAVLAAWARGMDPAAGRSPVRRLPRVG
jgi:ATP sulfurylase